MRRSFKYLAITTTNVSQPVIGTTTTAAVPISSAAGQSIPVADSSIFDQGQWAIIDVPVAAADIPTVGAGKGEERLMVLSIPDSTHIKVQVSEGGTGPTGCQIAHVSGCYIRPARVVASVYVQSKDGNGNPLFMTETPLGKTDGTRIISKLQNVPAGQQPTEFHDSFTSDSGPNPMTIGEWWIVGTIGDQYLPSFGVV